MSQELPQIEQKPKPVSQADVRLDSISASRAEVDKVFQADNVVDLEAYKQFRPEKAIAKESSVVTAIMNKVMELRRDRLNTQFFTHADRRGNFIHSIGRFLGFEVEPHKLEPLTEERLIKEESQLGSSIFGPLEDGEMHREFFFTDAKNAYFYRKVRNDSGNEEELTLHYEIVPQGILKSVVVLEFRTIS
jgi:hypothetical protein